MVPNAFCRSMRSNPVCKPESNPVSILSFKNEIHVSVEWLFLQPDWNLYKILFFLKTPEFDHE